MDKPPTEDTPQVFESPLTAVKILVQIGNESLGLHESAQMVRILMRVAPELSWVAALRQAIANQEMADANATSLRDLGCHMAPELLGFKHEQ